MPRSFWKLNKILFSLSLWSFRNISSIPPAAARAVFDSVRNSEPDDDLLTLVGIIAGQNIQAEELLISIRNEIQSTNR
ncbi:hypothetical protein [Alteromonas sp. PRIM-21]|uniref:hypothetical protein n=1 Tax=Alteromonas sp. PRIM-21 TaxID=1454978 RepID=UPI0022B95969|nr:hypothetical protein [Alteromonas sp. PRIM-21]MCZ8531222.1 hypothetical protein [Alteromonas sp. PRIM-21]